MNRQELDQELGQAGAEELLGPRTSSGSPTTDRTASRG